MGIPNNLADAVAAIRSGKVQISDTIKIGDLVVSVLTGISGGDTKEVSGRPVVAGYDTTEIARRGPWSRTLKIMLMNPDLSLEAGMKAALTGQVTALMETWADKLQRLRDIFDTDEIVTVQTLDMIRENCLVTGIEDMYDPDENWDCWIGSVTVAQIDLRQGGTVAGVADAMTASTKQVGAL
jgi:hypothetical protein